MCYRVATPSDLKDIEAEFNVRAEAPEAYIPYHHLNGFAGKQVGVITVQDPRMLSMVAWQSHNEFNSLNARSEEIFHPKKYWKKFTDRRAILPVKGFYESTEITKFNKKTGAPLKSGDKYPYFIYLEGKEIFGLACLISYLNTVSILTTAANDVMSTIHNNAKRMPAILHKEDYAKWLSPELSEEEMGVLMRPYENEAMSAYPISKLLYSKTEDANVPNVSLKFRYPEVALPVFKKGETIIENSQLLF